MDIRRCHQTSFRDREAPTVHLAAEHCGQLADYIKVGRHHVARKPATQLVLQMMQDFALALGVWGFASPERHVRGQFTTTGSRYQSDNGALNVRALKQDVLDLTQIDAMPAHLDLAVGAAQIDELPPGAMQARSPVR